MPTGIGRYRQRGAARDRIAGLLMTSSAPLTSPAIVERSGLSRALVAAELAALERAGWVERRKGGAAMSPTSGPGAPRRAGPSHNPGDSLAKTSPNIPRGIATTAAWLITRLPSGRKEGERS